MRLGGKSLILLLSIAAAPAADKNVPFRPGPPSSCPHHQTVSELSIGAEVYADREKTKAAFGKFDPARYGILPILVVMQNDSGKALRLDHMRVEYIRPDRRSIDPIPPEDIPRLRGAKKPRMGPAPFPSPIPGIRRKPKNPLAAAEIQERAFAARMLPPHDSAYGFFYFQSANHEGATLYITGITEAATGQELFYFEIPLN